MLIVAEVTVDHFPAGAGIMWAIQVQPPPSQQPGVSRIWSAGPNLACQYWWPSQWPMSTCSNHIILVCGDQNILIESMVLVKSTKMQPIEKIDLNQEKSTTTPPSPSCQIICNALVEVRTYLWNYLFYVQHAKHNGTGKAIIWIYFKNWFFLVLILGLALG